MAPVGDEYSTAPAFGFTGVGAGFDSFENYINGTSTVKITPQIAGNWLYNVKALTISNFQEFQGDPEGGVEVGSGNVSTSLTQKNVGSLYFATDSYTIDGEFITEVFPYVLPRTSCIYYLSGWDVDPYSAIGTSLRALLELYFFMYNGEFYAVFNPDAENTLMEISMNQITLRNNPEYSEADWFGSTETFTILETHYPVV